MRRTAPFLLVLLAACSSRPVAPHPLLPPNTQYSGLSTTAAGVGVMAAAVGSQVAESDRRSAATRNAGRAGVAGGMALMAVSLIDAIEVQKSREQFMNVQRAFYHHYGPRPDPPDRPMPTIHPAPEIPFHLLDAPSEEDPE